MSKPRLYEAVVLRTGYRAQTIRLESLLTPSADLVQAILDRAASTEFGSEHSSEYEIEALCDAETGVPVVIPVDISGDADKPLTSSEVLARITDEIMSSVAPLEQTEISQAQLVLETVKRVLSVILCGANTTPPCAIFPLGTSGHDLRLADGRYWPRNYDMVEASAKRGGVELSNVMAPTLSIQDALWAALARRERNTKAQA